MKFFFDLLPVLAFFVAFQIAGIYAATAVAIATTFVQVAWLKLRGKRVDAMLWASPGVIVGFGGGTQRLPAGDSARPPPVWGGSRGRRAAEGAPAVAGGEPGSPRWCSGRAPYPPRTRPRLAH